jgi:hypothetical protein
VDAYQHFFPSNPGARKVHDGHAAGSCCFTASDDGRQTKAFASLANIIDAASQLETHRQRFDQLTMWRVGTIGRAAEFSCGQPISLLDFKASLQGAFLATVRQSKGNLLVRCVPFGVGGALSDHHEVDVRRRSRQNLAAIEGRKAVA